MAKPLGQEHKKQSLINLDANEDDMFVQNFLKRFH